jgi:hypothetical protein
MRPAVLLVMFWTACARPPAVACGELTQEQLVDKTDLEGRFTHRAEVIAASAPSSIGSARVAELRFEITDDQLVARAVDDRIAWVMTVVAHADLVEGHDARTGERCSRAVPSGRAPLDRSHVRLDPTRIDSVDPTIVPVAADAMPVAAYDSDPESSPYPVRDGDRVHWSFVSVFATSAGTIHVVHTLDRID